jgi:erythromycin esterase
MKFFISSFLFLLFFATKAQDVNQRGSDPAIVKFAEQIGSAHSLIGLGESTHGTKEFTTLRTEIVKELVTQHNFRVFILEADLIPCTKINDYIQTGKGEAEDLLKDVLLWPWIHEDFLDLIHWMRTYNLNHPLDQLSFLGMDTQLSRIYATRDSIRKYDPTQSQAIFEILDAALKPKAKIKKLRALSNQLLLQEGKVDLRLQYYIFCRINRLANGEYRDLGARDHNMARMVQCIRKKYDQNIIIWSHNSHLRKTKSSFFSAKPIGRHLDELFKEDYAAIAFDCQQGHFLAVSYDEKEWHQNRVFQLKPIEQTVSMGIDHGDKRFVIVDCAALKGKKKINSIGAIYIQNPKKGDAFTAPIRKDKDFNYLISIPKSTPLELLNE